MSDNVRTIRITIEGRVQGVGFRYFVKKEALRRAIGGFVRNLGDGRVEVVAQGDPDAVAALAEACGRGPHAARVARVDIRDAPTAEAFHTFTQAPDG